jgi:hypothetical protein
MSKITRVSDASAIPGYISASFFGEEDVFAGNKRVAALQESSPARRAAISKEQKAWENERSAQTKRNDWEREALSDDDSMTQFLNKFHGKTIKRASYDTDDELSSFRPSPSDYLNDPINYYNAGGGIFGDLDSAVAQGMRLEMNMRAAKSQTRQSEAREAAREAEYRRQEKGILRERQEIMAHGNMLMGNRAKAVFRSGTDNLVGGNTFGMQDNYAIENRERQRLAMAENSRQERLRIRREGHVDIESRNRDWEENIDFGRKSYQDTDFGWVDFMVHGSNED